MHLFPLRTSPFTKWTMSVLPRAASWVYPALFNAFISATLFTGHAVGDARPAKRCIVDISRLESMQFSVSTSSGVKYDDLLEAGLEACNTMGPPDPVPTT